jgi:hypothetical protein
VGVTKRKRIAREARIYCDKYGLVATISCNLLRQLLLLSLPLLCGEIKTAYAGSDNTRLKAFSAMAKDEENIPYVHYAVKGRPVRKSASAGIWFSY